MQEQIDKTACSKVSLTLNCRFQQNKAKYLIQLVLIVDAIGYHIQIASKAV